VKIDVSSCTEDSGAVWVSLTMTTTKFQSQWLAVEMEAMGTLSLMGATSVQ
jgi:hypothetical protein